MDNLLLFPNLSLTNLVPGLSFPTNSFLNAATVGIFSLAVAVFSVLFITLLIISLCLIFKKAGYEWWKAIIPFYNLYVLTLIAGVPWWILLGIFIPLVNYVVWAYLYYQLSRRFGFDILFTIGLVFLPFIFLPILAFGSAVYTQPEVKEMN